jgi:protein TonB
MAGYRQSNPDRAKAAAATLVVHLAIGAALLTGLVNHVARKQADTLETFVVTEVPPPVTSPIVPEPDSAPKDEPAPPNLKANPSPIVAPKAKLPLPSPVPAAPVAGSGSAVSAGASTLAGPGTGAGGNGSGLGGGGSGEGFTPARKITKIPDREYRRITALSGSRTGSVGLSIRVGPDGAPAECRIARTSGNAGVDALMCQLTMTWVRFRPARDPQGRPVSQDVTWYPDWSPR